DYRTARILRRANRAVDSRSSRRGHRESDWAPARGHRVRLRLVNEDSASAVSDRSGRVRPHRHFGRVSLRVGAWLVAYVPTATDASDGRRLHEAGATARPGGDAEAWVLSGLHHWEPCRSDGCGPSADDGLDVGAWLAAAHRH